MIDESTDTFFTRLIAAILIDRPSCVFLAVAVIVGTFFSVVLFRAQDSDEFKFGLYGLVFVMIVMSLYVLHMIDQQMVRVIRVSDTTPTEIGEDILEDGDTFELEEELQELGPDPFAVETLSPGKKVQSHEFLPQPMILPESNQRSSDAISAGLVAGVIVMPIILLLLLLFPQLPIRILRDQLMLWG